MFMVRIVDNAFPLKVYQAHRLHEHKHVHSRFLISGV